MRILEKAKEEEEEEEEESDDDDDEKTNYNNSLAITRGHHLQPVELLMTESSEYK